MFGICHLSIVPCRKEPADKSEIVTQLLFGETLEVLEDPGTKSGTGKKSWTLIRHTYDDYECWIDSKQYIPLNDLKGISDNTTALTTEIVQLAEESGRGMIPVVLGSSLPKFSRKRFMLGKTEYSFDGDTVLPFGKKNHSGAGIVETARWYLNAPYLWGGKSPFGIDCSGFTQMVYKLNGIKLKRDAWQQAGQGKTLSFLEDACPGDLAFFDNEKGKIVHTGILLGKGKIIHASGCVRIDTIDHQGIFNAEKKKYTHRLRVIKHPD